MSDAYGTICVNTVSYLTAEVEAEEMTIGPMTAERDFLELVDNDVIKSRAKSVVDKSFTVKIGHGHPESAPVAVPARKLTKPIGLWEIILFAVICTADMLSTVYWYTHGQALEANPVLAYWLNKSVTAFCIAKLATFGPLLIACAILRERYARVITPGIRLAMLTYVIVYGCSVLAQVI